MRMQGVQCTVSMSETNGGVNAWAHTPARRVCLLLSREWRRHYLFGDIDDFTSHSERASLSFAGYACFCYSVVAMARTRTVHNAMSKWSCGQSNEGKEQQHNSTNGEKILFSFFTHKQQTITTTTKKKKKKTPYAFETILPPPLSLSQHQTTSHLSLTRSSTRNPSLEKKKQYKTEQCLLLK
ncbi:hypothetical protein BKA57DRAFT_103562 [Linnemannia elongata]|nr:hypothetical protein BKA57DRAFT_103562 [Linnemannia elongata]